jgi:hypothetical protein
LNGFIGEVTQPNRIPPPEENWSNIQAGIGRSDQGMGYGRYEHNDPENDQPRVHLMRAGWEWFNEKPLEEAIWHIFLAGYDTEWAFIPESSLYRILRLAMDVKSGKMDEINELIDKQENPACKKRSVSLSGKTRFSWDRNVFPFPTAATATLFKDQIIPLSAWENYLIYNGERGYFRDHRMFWAYGGHSLTSELRLFFTQMGLFPLGLKTDHLREAENGGFERIANLLRSMLMLRRYAGSEVRRKWVGKARKSHDLKNLSIDWMWFARTRVPKGWDEMETLARIEKLCETIDSDHYSSIHELDGVEIRIGGNQNIGLHYAEIV